MTARIYLDTNVFVYDYERETRFSDWAKATLELAERDEIVGVYSQLVVMELLIKPLRAGDEELAKTYMELLNSPMGYEAKQVDADVLLEAAALRTKQKPLKLPDAIHLATAQLSNCRAFVTADDRLFSHAGVAVIQLNASTSDRLRALA